MKKWKKFIAMGLAVSMIVPSCIPQTLWASEFSAGSVESAADVFEDGAEYETGSESGNKISDENNSGDEFGTGELKDQEPEQSETEDSVNAAEPLPCFLQAEYTESSDRMVPDRSLARGKLELCSMGALLRSDPHY